MRGAEHPLRRGCPAHPKARSCRGASEGTRNFWLLKFQCACINIQSWAGLAGNERYDRAAAAADFESRAVMPVRELGAYEALWAQAGTSFETLADAFRELSGSIPSDIVSQRNAEQYSRMALGTSRESGIRVHGVGDCARR